MNIIQSALLFFLISISGISQAVTNTAPTFVVSEGFVMTKVDPEGSSGISDVIIQPDGKLLAIGAVVDYAHRSDICVVRHNEDGSLDTSFSTDGIVTTDIAETGYSPNTDWVKDSVIQPDGKLIVVGYTHVVINKYSQGHQIMLLRYNADGSLDTTFSDDGITKFAFGLDGQLHATSVALQPDGKIIVGGYGKYHNIDPGSGAFLARYNSNGSLDTTFSDDGYLLDFGIATVIRDIAIQADGKVLVTGFHHFGDYLNRFTILARYNEDGSLDTDFADSGVNATQIGNVSSGNSIAIQEDGKILVGGESEHEINRVTHSFDFTLARYDTNGRLDETFANDGYATTDLYAKDGIKDIVIQPDGKILAGGRSGSGSGDFGLARYYANGEIDLTFGTNGIVTTDFYGGSLGEEARSIAIQSDGKIIAAGSVFFPFDDGSVHNFMGIARYNIDGSLDFTFNKEYRLGESISYRENQAPVYLDKEVKIYDKELNAAGGYAGATLTLARDTGENSDDVFSSGGDVSALNEGDLLIISGEAIGGVQQNSDGKLILLFNSNATQKLVNEALSSIKYSNSSDIPEAIVKIAWTFSDGNDGSQGDGGGLSTTGFTTVNISHVNNKPTASNNTVYISSDASYTFKLSDFRYSDAEDGSDLSAVNITSITSSGALKYDGFNLIANFDISASDIQSGRLTYLPSDNAGSSSFTFKVKDSADEYSSSSYTINFSFSRDNTPSDENIERLFDWAEVTYSDLFAPPSYTQTLGKWRYRFYSETNTYVGINDANEVYVLGDIFGGLAYVAPFSELFTEIP